MKHLAILGGGTSLLRLAGHLQAGGFVVTLLPGTMPQTVLSGNCAPDLVLLEVTSITDLERYVPAVRSASLPWLTLCAPGPAEIANKLTLSAYEAGAFAVLPANSGTDLVLQTVQRAVASLSPKSRPGEQPQRQRYQAGDVIPLRSGETLHVIDGVVAQESWRGQGEEGLIGLWGPGSLLTGSSHVLCQLSFRAHTRALVEADRLGSGRETVDSLLQRVQRLEAWACVQSGQSMEQRLFGVLMLLADQFGSACSEGTRIDVRVTHAQLAATIGSTRATVTRLLGVLRREGKVSTVASGEGERLCLPHGHSPVGRDAESGMLAQSLPIQ